MDNFKGRKTKGDKKINDSLIRLRKRVRKKTRKKQKGDGNLKKPLETSLNSHIFKPGGVKNCKKSRYKINKNMEGMLFEGFRSDYITKKTKGDGKSYDMDPIGDVEKFLMQKGGRLGRCLKRLRDGWTDKREPEKWAKMSTESAEDLEHCPLSPISGRTFEDQFTSTLGIKKTNELDIEKEFEIFSEKYEETVGNEVLLRLPRKGVLEDALNALGKIIKAGRRHDRENVFEEFQQDETQFSKGFEFSAKDFESENPAAEDFIKNFVFSDNLLVPKTDYYYESFMRKSFQDELLPLDDELENYHRLSFQPVLGGNDEEDDKVYVFASRGEKFECSAKNLSITTPPIQFYRRNMF